MYAKSFLSWTPTFIFVSLALCVAVPGSSRAEVFQWTDSRGVIHFTDNPSTIPEAVKGSPRLITRTDLDSAKESMETPPASGPAAEEPALEPEPAPAPTIPDMAKVPPPIVHYNYNPQHFTIVVVNSALRRPKKGDCASPQGCRGIFRPSFDDRRFIHPSAFDAAPR